MFKVIGNKKVNINLFFLERGKTYLVSNFDWGLIFVLKKKNHQSEHRKKKQRRDGFTAYSAFFHRFMVCYSHRYFLVHFTRLFHVVICHQSVLNLLMNAVGLFFQFFIFQK